MKLSHLLSITTAVAGAAVAARALVRRHEWEQTNTSAAICVDFHDARAAAIRAGITLDEMLAKLAHAGASHVSLPEWTLNGLLAMGELVPLAPAKPRTRPAPVGHWNYLFGENLLVTQLAEELLARLPQTEAAVIGRTRLVFAGDIPTIGEIGLGFDMRLAALIRDNALSVVPQPVSYAWPDPALLARTLGQAAQVGRTVAFAGDMILGHEMHLDATVQALADNDLTFVYFAESRHQKGDWFIAKRRAPHISLGHQFSPSEMVPLDYHAACQNWAHFARERGIRFCYVNFFRVLHATEPLEGLDYVHHLKHALEDVGLVVGAESTLPAPIPSPNTIELAAAGTAAAGVGAAAVADLLQLPESLALPLTLLSVAGAAALPHLEAELNQRRAMAHQHRDSHDHRHDQVDKLPENHDAHDHDHHDHDHGDLYVLYPPSYAPKLLALGAAVLGPISAQRAGLEGVVYQLAATAALAAVTSGQEYQLRIEEYRGFNLDWFIPMAAAVWPVPDLRIRIAALAGLSIGWLAAQRMDMDVLGRLDPGHAEGHTHHISAAMAALGDIQMALGPRPARKWAGLGSASGGAAALFTGNGNPQAAALARTLSALGYSLGLVGFRRPERALAETWQLAGPSIGVGSVTGLLLDMLGKKPA